MVRASLLDVLTLTSALGNFVIDAPFSDSYYRDPKELLMRIKMLTGVVEVGLFCGVSWGCLIGILLTL